LNTLQRNAAADLGGGIFMKESLNLRTWNFQCDSWLWPKHLEVWWHQHYWM